MNYYVETHKGNVRQNNEDSYFIPQKGERGFFIIVADGMGGHSAGEVASRIVVDTFRDAIGGMNPEDVTEEVLNAAMQKANSQVLADAEGNPDRHGMGSTATAAIFCGSAALIAHVGDSRAYIFHEGQLRQITRDHSYVQMLLDSGYINEQQAAGHPHKNIITRAVGIDPEITTDIYPCTLEAGDCLLLCSDGLNTMVNDEQIASVLKDGYEHAAQRLVAAALAAGGYDNVTVALAVKDGDRL